jgi:hypothetical protein
MAEAPFLHSLGKNLSTEWHPLACQLDDVYWAASRKKWRAKVTIKSPIPGDVPGVDNEMAWFPADSGALGTECISSLLTTDGSLGPNSHVLGQIQFHRDKAIWMNWGADFYDIAWDKTSCAYLTLAFVDDEGRTWNALFNVWYAGYAPKWPDWLLD